MLTRFWNAVVSFIGQVFRGPNGNFDFGRLAACHIITLFSFGWLYALIWLRSVPNWSELGTAYLTISGGVVALIAGKDLAVAKANAITTTATPSGASQ